MKDFKDPSALVDICTNCLGDRKDHVRLDRIRSYSSDPNFRNGRGRTHLFQHCAWDRLALTAFKRS